MAKYMRSYWRLLVKPPAARGALFEKTAPLDPPQKLLFREDNIFIFFYADFS
jgi:hypothetical protein